MNKITPYHALSACALAATLFLAACGGGAGTDTVVPTVAITSAAGTGSDVLFTFTFSEALASGTFTKEDIVVTGGTAGTFTMVDASHATLVVTPTTGAISASVAANKFDDVAHNFNTATASNTYTPPASQPSTSAPTPTASAGNVTSIYSDAYTATAGVAFASWGSPTVDGEVTIGSDKVKSLTGFTYEGIDFSNNKIDVSGKDMLHIDVWSPNIAELDLYVISMGSQGTKDNVKVAITPTQSAWKSVDIPLSAFAGVDLTSVAQIKLTNGPTNVAGGILYFDNLYFYKSTSSTNCVAGNACMLNFSSNSMGGSGFEGLVSSAVTSDPIVTSNSALKMVKDSTSRAWAGVNLFTIAPVDPVAGPFQIGAADFSTSKIVTLKMLSPAAGIPMWLKFSSAGGAVAEVGTTTSKANEWETLTFDFTGKTDASITYDRLAFFPDYSGSAATRLNTSSTYYLDDLSYKLASPTTAPEATVRGAGGLKTLTNGVWASDYQGDLATANSAKSTLGGSIGFAVDSRLVAGKKYDFGGISNAINSPDGTHNFYYGLGVQGSPITDGYFSAYTNAPANGYIDATVYSNLLLNVWGPAEQFQGSFTPNLKIVLSGPIVSGCTSNTQGSEVEAALIPAKKIGAASGYTIVLSSLTLKQACSGEVNAAAVLKKLAGISIQLIGTNIQYSVVDPNNANTYPNGLNIGPISFN